MINIIEALPIDQQQVMYDAIPNITLLIAGADGKIDPKELEWSEKIAEVRSFSFHEEWQAYYDEVSETMQDRINAILSELPEETNARQEELSNRLAKLNEILPNISSIYAKHFYDGLKSFANRIARADGGIFGWLSIGPKEAEVVELPMISPIK